MNFNQIVILFIVLLSIFYKVWSNILLEAIGIQVNFIKNKNKIKLQCTAFDLPNIDKESIKKGIAGAKQAYELYNKYKKSTSSSSVDSTSSSASSFFGFGK